MTKTFSFISFLLVFATASAQKKNYWQQHVDYKMDVKVDAPNYKYSGTQKLVYSNNSPDTLRKVYFHLYPNAFQPGSEMDARVKNIKDADKRMVNTTKVDGAEVKTSRMATLKPNEIGYLNITNLMQDGKPAASKTFGTILEVLLPKPILPNKKSTFTLNFEGQVPVQIRRSGRNNSEGVEFSMSQWYPKIAEFDFEGWHPDPYIAREFHGVWGNFDVKITIDKDYVLGGTGYLQNPEKIGHGYQKPGTKVNRDENSKTLTWHFKAPMVHDFTWAADKGYLHDVVKGPNNVDLHFIYKNNPKIIANWKAIQPVMVGVMDNFNKNVGNYPYKQYSFIQGGDGGMEYAMCTLMLGNGTVDGMLDTAVHELAHSWFQHVLASNEAKHPWMDEGFATYIEYLALNEIALKKETNPFSGIYSTYFNLVKSGKEQPQTTYADRYDENRPYSIASYYKGCLFLTQLGYIIGKKNLDETVKRYYSEFKFRHPTPNDIKRTAERVSGAELDWYLTDWAQTTNTIDYAIKNISDDGSSTKITLERIGRMPMPIDLSVEYTDGTKENFYIPLRMAFFTKENEDTSVKRTVLQDWAWAFPNFEFQIPRAKSSIKKITIDPAGMMADVNRENNVFEQK